MKRANELAGLASSLFLTNRDTAVAVEQRMVTAELTAAALKEDRLESTAAQAAQIWAPPLAPVATPSVEGIPLREEALRLALREEHPFRFPEQIGLPATKTGLSPRQKVIGAAAFVTALAAVALAYVLLAPADKKTPAQNLQALESVQASPAAAAQAPAPRTPAPAAELTAVAWPDLPASLSAAASPQPPATAPAANTASRQAVPALPKRDIVFSRRAGVSIRSTPAAKAAVLATASRGARFKVTKREGDWVEVENGRVKGWVKSQLLAPNKPPDSPR